jgi:hypothetical protein
MGGGKTKKAANTMMQQAAATETSRGQRFDERNQADLGTSREKGDDLYAQMRSGYGSLLTPQSYDSGVPAASSGGGGGGSRERLSELHGS